MPVTDELTIPDAASLDAKSFELLRVWIANGAQHVTLRSEVWTDPAAWGIFLVDLARHVAASFERDFALEPATALARIKEGFDAEWDHPTE